MVGLPYPPAPAKRCLDLIRSVEAPGGYGVVYANRQSRLPKPLVTMTINEVIADGSRRSQDRTGGIKGSSAAGAFQFMQKTLTGLRDSLGLTGSELMTPDLQDRLGYQLLIQRGYKRYMAGTMSMADFGNELAEEWASFPLLKPQNGKRRGQSNYAGDGQNHVLIAPGPVEACLRAMRAESALGAPNAPVLMPPPISLSLNLPQAQTVPATEARLSWWEKWFAPKRQAIKSRPGLHTNGDPALWDYQAGMKDRGYYTTGLLDGLDGRKTQAAVAQIRKDNGLGDGGIDAEFAAAFPGFPKAAVSKERATMSLPKAMATDPTAFKAPNWLVTAGLSTLGIGGASAGGALDQISAGIGKVNDVAGQIQGGLSTIGSVIAFLVEHKTLVLIGIGLFFTYRGVASVLRLWIDFRLARR